MARAPRPLADGPPCPPERASPAGLLLSLGLTALWAQQGLPTPKACRFGDVGVAVCGRSAMGKIIHGASSFEEATKVTSGE
jgi:hypothetical protein